MSNNQKTKILILENIRSVHNAGAIFRTADAVGISKIFLIGETPIPFDHLGRPRSDFAKTALGSEKTISWEYRKTILPVLKNLKKEKYAIIAIEQSENSVDYKKVRVGERTVCILGNEVSGVSKTALTHSDIIAEIPMSGLKESLNVSVAAGIVLFRLFDK